MDCCAKARPNRCATISRRRFGIKLIYADARERFLQRLAGIEDPERKRKVIGEEFVRVFEEYAEEAARRDLSGAGHALSGCHRERRQQKLGDDQDASQRRRPAGRYDAEGDRTAAPAV